MQTMTVLDGINEALKLIDTPEKWGKGYESFSGDKIGPICMAGAINKVAKKGGVVWLAPGVMPDGLAYFLLYKALEKHVPQKFHELVKNKSYTNTALVAFNDYPLTTHEEVMKVFENTIEYEKKGTNLWVSLYRRLNNKS